MEEEIIRIYELMALMKEHKFPEVKKILGNMNPIDVALLLGEAPEDKLLVLFRILPKENATEVFTEMDPEEQETLIKGFTASEMNNVIEEMFIDDAVDMIEEMPAVVVNKILKHANPETRKEINEILKYPEDSAGSVMTTEYMSLKSNLTVEEAFERIRSTGDEKEDIYTCYVIDTNRKLQGIVTVRDLLLSSKSKIVSEIMETNIISMHTLDDQEAVAKTLAKYDLSTIPICDAEDRLVGIVTVDDAIDVLQEENTEDFEKMAAVVPQEKSYFETSVWKHVKNRLPWLYILMFSSMLTGLVIEKYEDAFKTMPLLVALMPMLMDTSGNCGSQVSTLIIRGMALDEIKLRDFFKAMWLEFRVSFIVGCCLGIANGIRVWIQYHDLSLAIVIGSTLVFCVMIAKLLGCILPMLAKKMKLDPAIMASPLLTTVTDVTSVLIYFSIATFVMSY